MIWCLIPIRATVRAIEPRPATRYWTLSQGYRIAYTLIPAPAGSREGAPIVFLHGGPGGYVHSSTIAVIGSLAALGHDVYLYDQSGSGLSDRRARPKDYSFLGHVGDLEEIVARHIGASQVILIGHSYGGVLATEYLARHPERVERLVLSSPGSLEPQQFDAGGQWVNARRYVPPASIRFTPAAGLDPEAGEGWPPRALATMALATTLNVKLMSDREADDLLNTMASRFTREMVCDPAHVLPEEGGGGLYAHGWSNYFGDHEDPRPALRRLHTPVLVIQGACDFIEYASTYEYVDVLPNARYAFIEGAGHIVWWDKPAEYAQAITRFLEGKSD